MAISFLARLTKFAFSIAREMPRSNFFAANGQNKFELSFSICLSPFKGAIAKTVGNLLSTAASCFPGVVVGGDGIVNGNSL